MPELNVYTEMGIVYTSMLNLSDKDREELRRVGKLAIDTQVRELEQRFIEDRQNQCGERKI